jgi:hypothetical protein
MRFLNPGSFVAALLCFFLPFTNLQCNKNKLATFSGVELVKGTSIKDKVTLGMMGSMFTMGSEATAKIGNEQVREIPLIACAAILLLFFIAITVMTIKKVNPKKIKEWAIVGHVLALFMLIIEIVKMELSMIAANNEMTERASFMASTMKFSWGMEVGLLLALIITISFTIYNAVTYKKTGVVIQPAINNPPAQGPDPQQA